MNAVRKHLDVVKGGGLAQILYPACVYNLLFSDVPGNDLSVIASGPTIMDKTTRDDTDAVLSKYNIKSELGLEEADFIESPKDDKYFENVHNVVILSNDTALKVMKSKADELGISCKIATDSFESDANDAGRKLIEMCDPGSILLVGGETSLKVTGKGEGGRNQQLVLSILDKLDDRTIIVSFDSDGWDNSEACGAIGDALTSEHAKAKNLQRQEYLLENNSFVFFRESGDAILTGRLPSNVSDLMIVLKK
jgi:glycerate-2-kinase